jgi:catechol 2,3-dioxygenase-like lactoylglutathione lyase family enzyme
MRMKMNHVGLSVGNVDAAVAFYCDNFGMEKLSPIFPFGGPDFSSVMGLQDASGRMCMVANDTVRIELFEFANPVPKPKDQDYPVADHGYSHFGIDVEGIEDVFAKLSAAGVRFHCPVTTFSSGMKAAYGRDPDGNVFEIMEMGPKP